MHDINKRVYNLDITYPDDFDRQGREKYQSRNPLINLLMEQFYTKLLNQISRCYNQEDDFTMLDIGCGIGVVSTLIFQNFPNVRISGFDISGEAVKSAKSLLPSANLYVGDIYNLPYEEYSFDLVICLEVLEHLDQPETVIDNIARVCKNYAIISIPNYWRFRAANVMRFKYLERKGNTPGHVNEWTKNDFITLLSPYLKIINISNVMGIWWQYLCEKLNSEQ